MKRLLVIRFSALGDVAMLVPLIEQLAITYPDWQITMLSRKQVAPLFKHMPTNVQFVGADLKTTHHGIKGINQLLQEIQYQQFDAVADMHNVLRSKWICWRMRLAKKQVSVIRKGRWQKFILTHTSHKTQLTSTIQRYMHVLQLLNLPIAPLQTPPTTSVRQGYGIAPFAAHPGKIYPLDKMEQVLKALSSTGEPIYLFGAGDKEKTILEAWEKKYDKAHSLVGKYKMDEEIALMRHLRLMLTMDSANMHLASLAGTRVISIWGATHPYAGFLGWGQQPTDCIQRNDLNCRPCSIYGNKKCKYGDYRCLNIAPQTILQQINHATKS